MWDLRLYDEVELNMAKICLISFYLNTGYYPSFNHGLAYLIGALKRANHRVSFKQLLNESDFDETIEYLKKEVPDVVGLSFTTNQKKYVRTFLNKTKLDKGLVVAGGVHVSLVRDEIFNDLPELDGICIGEGEEPLGELCRRLDKNEDYSDIPSFYFKTRNGVIKNPILPLRDLDGIGVPDYTLFECEKVIKDSGDCFPMMISRGCPYSCSYCCNHSFREIYPNKHKYVRFPSVGHAIKIIRNNLSLYPKTEKIIFNDDVLVFNAQWLAEFCNTYKKEIGLPFRCNARVESINDDVARSLKNAGCLSIAFGIESGSEWVRTNILKRKYSNKQIEKAFSTIRKHGIKTFSYNIVGLPFETEKMVKETLNINVSCRPDFGKCFYFYPYPKTTIYQLCEQYGLFLDDLETASGILDSPSIKELFMKHNEIIKHFELLNVFFYSRLVFSKIRIPALFEKWLLKVIFLLRKPILLFLDPNSSSRTIRIFRGIMRKYALKYIR